MILLGPQIWDLGGQIPDPREETTKIDQIIRIFENLQKKVGDA